MNCQWQSFLSILPGWMVQEVDLWGRKTLLELRLRVDLPAVLVMRDGLHQLSGTVSREDIEHCINSASRYSPWAAASVKKGYLSAPGGHRLGLCGEAIYKDNVFCGIRNVTSVCIRVARDFPGISGEIPETGASVLILGAPGWGKTTLLRDFARKVSQRHTVGVVDERNELFPEGFAKGRHMDVMSSIRKTEGIEMLLRTMGPEYIAMDEITDGDDCAALLRSAGCGVKLIATAHAGSLEEYHGRNVYKPLWEGQVFDVAVILRRNKTFTVERMRK